MIATVALGAVALGSAVVVPTAAHAEVAVLQVTNTDDDGPGSLRAALVEASSSPSDDRITFASTVTGTITLTSGELDVALSGSSGSLTLEGPGSDTLTLDAEGRSRVLDVQGGDGAVRSTFGVSGLTLTGGFARGSSDGGGALRATGVDLVLDRLTVADNRTDGGNGGGIAITGAGVLVSGSRITGNTTGSPYAPSRGGGIYFDDSGAPGAELAIHDSIISDNASGFGGGGIHSSRSAPVTVTRSTVSGNTASHTWRGSEAVVIHGNGGGISAGDLTVVQSRIVGNEAAAYGGGLEGGTVVVTRSTVADNRAGESGGGIFTGHAEGGLRVESSTLTGNYAKKSGGGLRAAGAMPVEVNLSTIADNAAPTGGGLSTVADITLHGSIVAMNAGGDLDGSGSATLIRSLVQDSRKTAPVAGGGSIIGEDPLLGPLADHGGPTETLLPASNSPVIDRGDAFGATTDQRGSARPVDHTQVPDAADGSDIGAVEVTATEMTGLPQVGSTARPIIAGRFRVGQTLHTDGGAWEPADPSLSYQWFRNGRPISGATEASYTLTPADHGTNHYGDNLKKRVAVRVTATAPEHREASAVSDYTAHVRKGTMRVSRPARVVGKLRVGSTLRAKARVGAITPRPTDVFVTWYLNGRYVDSARGRTRLKLEPRMRGKRVKVRFYYWHDSYRRLKQVAKARRPVR